MTLKSFFLLFIATVLFETAGAQVPAKFAFQGVARNSSGQAVANKTISVRFTIHEDAEAGNIVYQETHQPVTSATGVFNVSIGSGAVVLGNMQSIIWTNAAYFLQVELDPAGGNAFSQVSTAELLSVPYAINTRSITGSGSTALSHFGSNAIGYNNKATAKYALAGGSSSTASADFAMALGHVTTASGVHSTAMGNYVSTLEYRGSFIIGDYRAGIVPLTSSADNQMTMRFGGGYRLFTGTISNGSTLGVTLASNGNSWASISDSTKKENYSAANGAAFLSKIKNMKLGSWNYKGQDKKQYRHYGPMAQEFYSLFGNDGTGTIGNDTTIASADIDGVMMIALQALIKQSEEMKKQVEQLSEANKTLLKQVQQLEAARKEN